MKPPIPLSLLFFPAVAVIWGLFQPAASLVAEPWRFDLQNRFVVELDAEAPTGAAWFDDRCHLFVIEHRAAGGTQIAHLTADRPEGPFQAADRERYLQRQADGLVYSGHFTPLAREGHLQAAFWTAGQRGARYGLLGYPVAAE